VRDVRVGGEHEDPRVPFQGDPALAESELAELLDVLIDLGGKRSEPALQAAGIGGLGVVAALGVPVGAPPRREHGADQTTK
jgi:hypothetical protein